MGSFRGIYRIQSHTNLFVERLAGSMSCSHYFLLGVNTGWEGCRAPVLCPSRVINLENLRILSRHEWNLCVVRDGQVLISQVRWEYKRPSVLQTKQRTSKVYAGTSSVAESSATSCARHKVDTSASRESSTVHEKEYAPLVGELLAHVVSSASAKRVTPYRKHTNIDTA